MSVQWMVVAGILYVETFMIILLLLPLFTPQMWCRVFQSGFCQWVLSYSKVYSKLYIGGLVLLFLESIREVWKFSNATEVPSGTEHADLTRHMRLFLAQRNLQVSGYALFCCFVLRRLVVMLIREGSMSESESSTNQESQGTKKKTDRQLLGEHVNTTHHDNDKNAKAVDEAEDDHEAECPAKEKKMA